MNAIILCGGLSTRLGEITKTCPKILLPIGPKTVLDWQLEKMRSLGITEVVLAAGHLATAVQKEVGFSRQGLEIIYAIEDKKLGTGGAIKHAWKYVRQPEEPVLVLNGDVLVAADLSSFCQAGKEDSEGLILGAKVPDAASYGTLEFAEDGHLQAFKEKTGQAVSGYINGGVYFFNANLKKYFPETDEFSIEYDVFPRVRQMYVYPTDQPWVDVGVPERLAWARKNWQIFL
ncbi:MAG TPA: sugar phosphate nucleotidyltransferase [Patescibacteria group bacterium]|nr:sugar phosphate nucleotidyltransferase [Patescibacteria group bacterium]